MNNKGFVLVETLVVTIFTLITFTLLYTGVVPLIGRYSELSYYDNIDVTYDLYHLKKMLVNDDNYTNILSNNYKIITCDDTSNQQYCEAIFDGLGITNNDEVIYINTSYIDDIIDDNEISQDTKNYLKYVSDNFEDEEGILVLNKNNYLSYIENLDIT